MRGLRATKWSCLHILSAKRGPGPASRSQWLYSYRLQGKNALTTDGEEERRTREKLIIKPYWTFSVLVGLYLMLLPLDPQRDERDKSHVPLSI
jgi:hypothetical protein